MILIKNRMLIRHQPDLKNYASITLCPFGKMGILIKQNCLVGLDFLDKNTRLKSAIDPISKHVISELNQYFANPKHKINLEYYLAGTPFQQRVWQALKTIKSAETLSYGMLAQQLKTSPRAIGQACRTNPLPIVIPCHRIIAANGMGGFAGKRNGFMMEVKQWLLRHEGVSFFSTTSQPIMI